MGKASVKPYVFLSYSTRNPFEAKLIKRIKAALDQAGFVTWLASVEMIGGESWRHHISCEINSRCSHFLVLWSAASRESQFVRHEVDVAFARYERDQAFAIIPAIVGANGSDSRSIDLQELQIIQYADESRFLNAIVAAIRKPPDQMRQLPLTRRGDSWSPQLRSILRVELDRQLHSRNPWTTKEQLATVSRTAASDFFKRRGGLPHAKLAIPNVETHVTGGPNSQVASGWRRDLEICIAPTNVAAAGTAVFMRDSMNLPITLHFGYSSGVAIVDAIHRKEIFPDAFVAGDVQSLTVGDEYYWTLALATVEDVVVARHQGDFRAPDFQGVYLAPEFSTLERAYYVALDSSAMKRTRLEHMDPSDALDRILLGDLDVRAILWPPLTQMAEDSGLIVKVITPRKSRWNAVLYCSQSIITAEYPVHIDVFSRAFIYAWGILKMDKSQQARVIDTLVRDEVYSGTTRRMVRYDQIIVAHGSL